MKLEGHCFRHTEEVASSCTLDPFPLKKKGKANQKLVQQLEKDTGLDACKIGAR